MARDGDNPMKLQLHRVGLDGKGDTRLTDPAFHHTVDLSPRTASTSSTSPRRTTRRRSRRLVDADGKVVAELAKSDLTKFDELGLKKAELFTFKAADGKTELHGMLHFPSNFDPDEEVSAARRRSTAGPSTNGGHARRSRRRAR